MHANDVFQRPIMRAVDLRKSACAHALSTEMTKWAAGKQGGKRGEGRAGAKEERRRKQEAYDKEERQEGQGRAERGERGEQQKREEGPEGREGADRGNEKSTEGHQDSKEEREDEYRFYSRQAVTGAANLARPQLVKRRAASHPGDQRGEAVRARVACGLLEGLGSLSCVPGEVPQRR